MDRVYVIEDFTRATLEEIYRSHEGKEVVIWSPAELEFLGRTSPTTIRDLNTLLNTNLSYDEHALKDQARALTSYVLFSMDNSVFRGVLNVNMARSKVDNLEKICKALGIEAPLRSADVTQENMIEMIYEVKRHALDIGASLATGPYEMTTLVEDGITLPQELHALFNNSIAYAIEFGARGGKDIDALLLVDKLDLGTYERMWDAARHIPTQRPIGIVLLPKDALRTYAGCDYHSFTVARSGALLYGGEISFPHASEQDVVHMNFVSSGKELTSLRGAIRRDNRLAQFQHSPKFLRETLKNEIWIGKAIAQKTHGYLSKSAFLALEPVTIADLGEAPEQAEVERVLLDANFRVKRRIERYLAEH